jgi:hypothetical protein
VTAFCIKIYESRRTYSGVKVQMFPSLKKIDRFTHLFPLTGRFLLFSVAKSGTDK